MANPFTLICIIETASGIPRRISNVMTADVDDQMRGSDETLLVLDALVSLQADYWNGEEWLPRPRLDVQQSYSGPLVELTVPVGTAVRIDGVECGLTEDASLTLELNSLGTYQVVLTPPLPAMEAAFEVVTE